MVKGYMLWELLKKHNPNRNLDREFYFATEEDAPKEWDDKTKELFFDVIKNIPPDAIHDFIWTWFGYDILENVKYDVEGEKQDIEYDKAHPNR